MTSLDEILNAANALSPGERAQLIASLWDTSSPNDWVIPNAGWIAEAGRRSDAYDAEEMAGSPWADVRERARRKAGLGG